MKKLQPHPIAEIFPQMDDDQFAALKADIEANGLELPGLLHEGKILDGRNRYRACLELGIEMRWQDTSGWELTSEDSKPFAPIQYVLSHNLHRRHLTPSQRAMVAARIANLKEGRPSKETSQNCGVSKREDAAKLLNVSSRSIDAAEAFDGSPSDPWDDAEEPGDGCPRCGSLASWWSIPGTQRCLNCEPPRPDADAIRENAARIRKRTMKTWP